MPNIDIWREKKAGRTRYFADLRTGKTDHPGRKPFFLLAASNEAFPDSPFLRVTRQQRQYQPFLSAECFGKRINFGRARYRPTSPLDNDGKLD